MSIERSIVQRLLESRGLTEAEFTSGGSTYKCVFGKYYKDGEAIDRDEYFRAKEEEDKSSTSTDSQGSDKPFWMKDDDEIAPQEIDDALDKIEDDYEELKTEFENTPYDDRDDLLSKVEDMMKIISYSEGAMSDEQYERSQELWSMLRKMDDIEYREPEPDWDMMSGGHDDY